MDVEPPSRSRRARVPARPAERVYDLTVWVLITLAMFTAVLAVAAGVGAHDEVEQRARAEAAERRPVQAVLLADAEVFPAADGYSEPRPVLVEARWTAADGGPRTGAVLVYSHLRAGSVVPAWVDAAERVVPAPPRAGAPVTAAVLRGSLILIGGWAVLVAAGLLVRRWCEGRNLEEWAREWARVEPRWSGRHPA